MEFIYITSYRTPIIHQPPSKPTTQLRQSWIRKRVIEEKRHVYPPGHLLLVVNCLIYGQQSFGSWTATYHVRQNVKTISKLFLYPCLGKHPCKLVFTTPDLFRIIVVYDSVSQKENKLIANRPPLATNFLNFLIIRQQYFLKNCWGSYWKRVIRKS